MSTEKPKPGGTVWDAPNQQTVREDQSAPWEEGTGGGTQQTSELDSMTKAQLLDYAKSKGISPANNDMTKEELRAAIDEAEGGES